MYKGINTTVKCLNAVIVEYLIAIYITIFL